MTTRPNRVSIEATMDIRADLDLLVTVRCPRCKTVLGQASMQAGEVLRHRCRRCGDWTVFIGVPVPTPPARDIQTTREAY